MHSYIIHMDVYHFSLRMVMSVQLALPRQTRRRNAFSAIGVLGQYFQRAFFHHLFSRVIDDPA